jgi:hypothetical protein
MSRVIGHLDRKQLLVYAGAAVPHPPHPVETVVPEFLSRVVTLHVVPLELEQAPTVVLEGFRCSARQAVTRYQVKTIIGVVIVVELFVTAIRVIDPFYPAAMIASVDDGIIAFVGFAIEPMSVRIRHAGQIGRLRITRVNAIIRHTAAIRTHMPDFAREAAAIVMEQESLDSAPVPDLMRISVEMILALKR